MAELIRKEEVIEKIWSVYNKYGNNSLAFSDEKIRAIDKACGLVQKEVEKLPIVTEAELRSSVIDEFAEAIMVKATELSEKVVFDGKLVGDALSLDCISDMVVEIASQMKGEKE